MEAMDMTLAVQGLVNLFVNMDGNSRVMFIRLLVTKMKDEEIDVFLEVVHFRQKAENSQSSISDVSKFLDIELKQEPVVCDADSYLQSTSWWNNDDQMTEEEAFENIDKKNDKKGKIKNEKQEKLLGAPKEKPHYYCDKCDKKYVKKSDLVTHMETTHEGVPNLGIPNISIPKEKKYYYCDKCDKKCGKKADLAEHVKAIHEGLRFQCDQCDYQATRKCNLLAHVKRYHLGIERKQYEKRFVCDKCSKKFAQNYKLLRHISEVHDRVRYPCDQCDYQATKKWHLQQHCEAEHKGVRYPCGQCNYEAKTKQTLQRHIESIHEGIRYACDYCEYKATQIACLKKHLQLMHRSVPLPQPSEDGTIPPLSSVFQPCKI